MDLLAEFDKKYKSEQSELIDNIRKVENLLQIKTADLNYMDTDQLKSYLQRLRDKYSQHQKSEPAQTASLPEETSEERSPEVVDIEGSLKKESTEPVDPEQETESEQEIVYKGVPADVMLKAIRIGSKYEVTGEQICDRYLQVCRKESFDTEAVRDLEKNVLETWDKGCELAFIESIQKGFLDEPPFFYTEPPEKEIARQLDSAIPNWRKLRESALCYMYHKAIQELNEEIYVPLGSWLTKG